MAILDGLLAPWRKPDVIPPQPQKAGFGSGVVDLTYSVPLSAVRGRTPQARALQAIDLYETNDYIREAEDAVSDRGGSVAYHLEDGQDNEIDDTSDAKYLAVRSLIETPQAALDPVDRQPGLNTRRGMWTITLRHTGLCGTAFWYLDQTEALAGTPAAILYLAPWRMFPTYNPRGLLLGWALDRPIEEGGTPLELANVLPFYLSPPDRGYFASGKIDAAWRKANLASLITTHLTQVIGSGGRLTGLISPKEGSTVTDDQWATFISNYRNITADPNAAQRLQIVKGAVDYVRTAATPDELGLDATDERTRDAILALWKVPRSQAAIEAPAGLNSGSTKGFDEAILWQGAIHPRLLSLYETIQYGLLDRYKKVGTTVELVIDEPSFDDDTPLYQRATQAASLPLTNDERREIVGFPPLEKDLAEFGPQIWLPTTLAQVAGPGFAEQQAADQAAQAQQTAEAMSRLNAPVGTPVQAKPADTTAPGEAVKAGPLGALRERTDAAIVPKIKATVLSVLSEQRAAVVRRLKNLGLEKLRNKPGDKQAFWHDGKADATLEGALTPFVEGIVTAVSRRAERTLKPAKAQTAFADRVTKRVLTKGAGRITGINQTTRDAVSQAIADALDGADTINDIIGAVEALDIFGELRAETIARTESMFAYNDAALGSYAEFGVTEVQAIDGDGDEECAARDGQTFSLEEAEGIEDHPNGTLDWVPLLPDEPVKAEPIPRRTTVQKINGRWVIEDVA